MHLPDLCKLRTRCRRELARSECLDLDTHIRRHRLGRPCLTVTYDHSNPSSAAAGAAGSSRGSPAGATADLYSSDAAADAVQQHQREASDLLRALFATSGGGSGGGGGGLSVVVDADADEEQRDSMAREQEAFPVLEALAERLLLAL